MPDENKHTYDENKHTYRERFEKHYLAAEKRLSPLDGELSWSTADFELFKFKSEKLCIMFYPHQTSRGNYHVRFRKCGSGNDDTKMNIAAFLLRQLGIDDGLKPGVDRFFKQHNDPILPSETKQKTLDLIKSSNFAYKAEFLDAIENYKNTAVLI